MASSLVAQGNSNPWGSNHPEETHTNTNGNGHNGGHNGWGHGHHGGNSGGNGNGGNGGHGCPGGEPVPEPGTMLLAGSGLAAVFAARRKRKNAVEEIVSE